MEEDSNDEAMEQWLVVARDTPAALADTSVTLPPDVVVSLKDLEGSLEAGLKGTNYCRRRWRAPRRLSRSRLPRCGGLRQHEIGWLMRSNAWLSGDKSVLRVQNKEFHAKVDRLEAAAKEHEQILASRAVSFDLQDKEVNWLKEHESFLLEKLMNIGRVAKDALAYNRVQQVEPGERAASGILLPSSARMPPTFARPPPPSMTSSGRRTLCRRRWRARNQAR